jgi:hypothetical protein
MIEVAITEDMKASAKEKTAEMPNLKNSVMNGERNYIGFLGEEVAKKVLSATTKNTYDYDLVLSDGTTVDVKSKRTTVEPKPHYDCTVFGFNTKQKCDYYAFVRIDEDRDRAWFLGVYKKGDYFLDSKLMKKGDVDKSNNLTFKADCYNLPISELKELVQ